MMHFSGTKTTREKKGPPASILDRMLEHVNHVVGKRDASEDQTGADENDSVKEEDLPGILAKDDPRSCISWKVNPTRRKL